MANEPERLIDQRHPGEGALWDRMVRVEEIAGDGAERSADEDGQQRGG